MRGGDIEHAQDLIGGAVTGASLHIVEEGFAEASFLFTETIQLDSQKSHVLITASGRDKPGWVAQLSRHVADAGGSVTESKMVRLGDEFIILMHVAIDPEQQKILTNTIGKSQQLKPLQIKCQNISKRKTGTYQAAVSGVRIHCSGADKDVPWNVVHPCTL
jgi:predicted amino acid-binding ACT domain protein